MRNTNKMTLRQKLNTEKAAGIVVEDFRSGRLGRITLEQP